MLWFLRGIRKGVVTTRYPSGSVDSWAAALPSPPAFRADLLTRELAGRVADACLTGALRIEKAGTDAGKAGDARPEDRAPAARRGDDLLLDLGSCTGCGACIAVGGEAVVPSGEFELASRDRAALFKRIPIGGGR